MEHQQTRQFQHESIGKLLLRFSIPATVGTFVNSLYNVVDRIFIGQGIGADGLAAAMIAFPIMMIVMALGMLIAFGSGAIISIRLGEKNVAEAERVLGQAVFLLVVFGVMFTLAALLLLTPMLRLFGASDTVLPLAKDYTQIIILGVIFHEISFGVNNFIRGEGNPRVAMLTMIVGAGLNIILDPIFIFGLDMGMRGAALATILAQAVSALWVMAYYWRGRSVLKIRRHHFRLDVPLARRVINLGSPPFVMNIANVFILAFVNNSLKAYGGDIAIAVMGVIFTVYTLNLMPIIGLSQGAQPIFGYNHGAQDFARVKKTLLLAMKTVTAFCAIATTVILFFPKYTFLPFSRGNTELVGLGVHAIQITMSMFPVVGFMVILSNYFQATARPQISLFLHMLRQVLVLIPCVLILPHFIGTDGVWYAYPLSAWLSFFTCLIYYIRELRVLSERKQPAVEMA